MAISPMPAFFLDPSKILKAVAFMQFSSLQCTAKEWWFIILNLDKSWSFPDSFCPS